MQATTEDDERYYVFGNYIDEVLLMTDELGGTPTDHYYGHDHLFSPVILFASNGTTLYIVREIMLVYLAVPAGQMQGRNRSHI